MNRIEDFDSFLDEVLLEKSFAFYCHANNIEGENKKRIKDKIFKVFPKVPNSKDQLLVKEIFVGNENKSKKSMRVALVNELIDANNFISSLKGIPKIYNREQSFTKIQDEISDIENLDMYIMAELSLPHEKINDFTRHCKKNNIALVTGLEFFRVGNIVYNFILTVLPFTIDGIQDACPIFRLKNDYTHSEYELINGLEGRLKVPKLKDYIYHLYRWRNISFSTYYCFELANIKMRSIFFGMVDLLIAPVYNRDNYYYNAIAESTCRDLHCYFIQVNTSEYGETRILQPVKSIEADIARVKGGTIKEDKYRVSFLISDLKINDLREAQLLSYSLNKNPKFNRNGFKPLPPNWDFNKVKMRKKNESFFK